MLNMNEGEPPQWFTALLIKPIPVKFILTADQSETEKDMFAGKQKYENMNQRFSTD